MSGTQMQCVTSQCAAGWYCGVIVVQRWSVSSAKQLLREDCGSFFRKERKPRSHCTIFGGIEPADVKSPQMRHVPCHAGTRYQPGPATTTSPVRDRTEGIRGKRGAIVLRYFPIKQFFTVWSRSPVVECVENRCTEIRGPIVGQIRLETVAAHKLCDWRNSGRLLQTL